MRDFGSVGVPYFEISHGWATDAILSVVQVAEDTRFHAGGSTVYVILELTFKLELEKEGHYEWWWLDGSICSAGPIEYYIMSFACHAQPRRLVCKSTIDIIIWFQSLQPTPVPLLCPCCASAAFARGANRLSDSPFATLCLW